MKRGTKVLAAGAAVAAGPSGLRRFLGLILVVVLILGLGLAALMALGVWSASQGGDDSPTLPCPPEPVAVAYSPKDTPAKVQQAVATALMDAGREVTEGGWGEGQRRDLVVVWTPGSETRLSGSTSPTKLTLGSVPTAAEVTDLLGDRITTCDAATPTPAPAEAEEPAEDAQEPGSGFTWPWADGITPVAGIGLAVALWWLAGPNLTRGAWRALWPLRLTRRRVQRWRYRMALRHGRWPDEWPSRIEPGQRWHESDEAMRDRKTHRQQIAETEPERKAALRTAIRKELASPDANDLLARVLRVVYRVRLGTPEKSGGLR